MFCFLSYTSLSCALESHFPKTFCLPRVSCFSRKQPLSCLPARCGSCWTHWMGWSYQALRPQAGSEVKNLAEEEPLGLARRT